MRPLFIATDRFGPWNGDRWYDFVTWSGLTHLTELVSLDGTLCARVLDEIKDAYWPHIVNEDFMLAYFTDLDFMLDQLSSAREHNILCVFREPASHPVPPGDLMTFAFVGYDLIEPSTGISALSNCGGFPKAFADHQLNQFGLLETFETAVDVQTHLETQYSDEPHAQCQRWAIFRARGAIAGAGP